MREFKSPSGRSWLARLFYFPNTTSGTPRASRPATSGSVLRFQSDDLTLDLADWPDDWLQMTDAELLDLLRRATTPTFAPPRLLTPTYQQHPEPDGKGPAR